MTKVYGSSDDLVEFEGDFSGEVSCYGTDDNEHGILIVFSDGTIIEAKYGDGGNWTLSPLHKGKLFGTIKVCDKDDEDNDPNSDVVTFKAGIKWAYAATEWENVK